MSENINKNNAFEEIEKNISAADGSYFPVNIDGLWHGGIHINLEPMKKWATNKNTEKVERCEVYSPVGGEIVAGRIDYKGKNKKNFFILKDKIQLTNKTDSILNKVNQLKKELPGTSQDFEYYSVLTNLSNYSDYENFFSSKFNLFEFDSSYLSSKNGQLPFGISVYVDIEDSTEKYLQMGKERKYVGSFFYKSIDNDPKYKNLSKEDVLLEKVPSHKVLNDKGFTNEALSYNGTTIPAKEIISFGNNTIHVLNYDHCLIYSNPDKGRTFINVPASNDYFINEYGNYKIPKNNRNYYVEEIPQSYLFGKTIYCIRSNPNYFKYFKNRYVNLETAKIRVNDIRNRYSSRTDYEKITKAIEAELQFLKEVNYNISAGRDVLVIDDHYKYDYKNKDLSRCIIQMQKEEFKKFETFNQLNDDLIILSNPRFSAMKYFYENSQSDFSVGNSYSILIQLIKSENNLNYFTAKKRNVPEPIEHTKIYVNGKKVEDKSYFKKTGFFQCYPRYVDKEYDFQIQDEWKRKIFRKCEITSLETCSYQTKEGNYVYSTSNLINPPINIVKLHNVSVFNFPEIVKNYNNSDYIDDYLTSIICQTEYGFVSAKVKDCYFSFKLINDYLHTRLGSGTFLGFVSPEKFKNYYEWSLLFQKDILTKSCDKCFLNIQSKDKAECSIIKKPFTEIFLSLGTSIKTKDVYNYENYKEIEKIKQIIYLDVNLNKQYLTVTKEKDGEYISYSSLDEIVIGRHGINFKPNNFNPVEKLENLNDSIANSLTETASKISNLAYSISNTFSRKKKNNPREVISATINAVEEINTPLVISGDSGFKNENFPSIDSESVKIYFERLIVPNLLNKKFKKKFLNKNYYQIEIELKPVDISLAYGFALPLYIDKTSIDRKAIEGKTKNKEILLMNINGEVNYSQANHSRKGILAKVYNLIEDKIETDENGNKITFPGTIDIKAYENNDEPIRQEYGGVLYEISNETKQKYIKNYFSNYTDKLISLNVKNKGKTMLVDKTICPQENSLVCDLQALKSKLETIKIKTNNDREISIKDYLDYGKNGTKTHNLYRDDLSGKGAYKELLSKFLKYLYSKHPTEFDAMLHNKIKFENIILSVNDWNSDTDPDIYTELKKVMKPESKNKEEILKSVTPELKNSFYFVYPPDFYRMLSDASLLVINPYASIKDHKIKPRFYAEQGDISIIDNPGFSTYLEKTDKDKFIVLGADNSYYATVNVGFNVLTDQRYGNHMGIDFSGNLDGKYTKIRAFVRGTVWACTYDQTVAEAAGKGYGRVMIIKGEDNLLYMLCHLSEYLKEPGDPILPGDDVAVAGNTGNSSGAHLHLEIHKTTVFGSLYINRDVILNTKINNETGNEIYNQKEPNAGKSNGLTWTEIYRNSKLIVNPFNHNEPYRK